MRHSFKLIAVLSLLVSGCNTLETVNYEASQNQSLLVRDGVNSILSKGNHSLVLVQPASREMSGQDSAVFLVGISSMSAEPLTFRVSDVSVVQTRKGKAVAELPVKTYEDLVRAEKRRQVIAAIATGIAAAGNSMQAANAGYSTGHGTYSARTTGPYGPVHTTGTVNATVYNPGQAYAARTIADAQNQAMINQTVATGRQNLARLGNTVIKDNTLLPGEWYGGQLHFRKPTRLEGDGGVKTYLISVQVGSDVHQIRVTQSPAG